MVARVGRALCEWQNWRVQVQCSVLDTGVLVINNAFLCDHPPHLGDSASHGGDWIEDALRFQQWEFRMLWTAEHQAVHDRHSSALPLAEGGAQVSGTAPPLHGRVTLARDLIQGGDRRRRWCVGERRLLLSCHRHI